MKRILIFLLVMVLAMTAIGNACNINGIQHFVKGYRHHCWTVFYWINYWQSSIVTTNGCLYSDTENHDIQSILYVYIGDEEEVLLDHELTNYWQNEYPNTLWEDTVYSELTGYCDHSDCDVQPHIASDGIWEFDNDDPRSGE